MPATRAMVAMARSMFGAGRDFRLTSARTASATASWADFGAARRHALDGLGIAVADGEEDLVFSLVQLCASATGQPLTDDELRLIAGYPQQLALLFPGQMLDTVRSW